MAGEPYEKLAIWQKAVDLVQVTFALNQTFEPDLKGSVGSQMTRAVVGMPTKIAEACVIDSLDESVKQLNGALASIRETISYVCLAERLGGTTRWQTRQLRKRAAALTKIIEHEIALLHDAMRQNDGAMLAA